MPARTREYPTWQCLAVPICHRKQVLDVKGHRREGGLDSKREWTKKSGRKINMISIEKTKKDMGRANVYDLDMPVLSL